MGVPACEACRACCTDLTSRHPATLAGGGSSLAWWNGVNHHPRRNSGPPEGVVIGGGTKETFTEAAGEEAGDSKVRLNVSSNIQGTIQSNPRRED